MKTPTMVILVSLATAGCLGEVPPTPGSGAPGSGNGSGNVGGGGGSDPGSSGGGSGVDPGGGVSGGGSTAAASDGLDTEPDPFVGAKLKTGPAQLADLCARGNADAVSKAFCASPTPPAITSLVDLQKLVGLAFQPGQTGNATGGNPGFALTGHSSSLVTRFISAINPRAILFTPPKSTGRVNNPQPLASFSAIGFARGEQFVEMVSNDPVKNDLNFFLLRFQQACNTQPGGCTNGNLLTPAIESGFTSYTLYQDTDIKNTVFDCQQCHQTGGPSAKKILRQQELQNPWGHFFRNNRANGQVMLADFGTAHATTETFAGIPGAAITNSDPAQLEGLVENQGFKAQPNEFITNNILDKGPVAAWLTLYTNAKSSLDIPPPYHENRVTDPAKLTAAASAYSKVMAGTLAMSMLPDIRNVFLDAAMQDLTFRPSADLVTAQNGKGIMVQMCQQCHNPTLDQTISRAKFDVTKLATMDPAEKAKAIVRLNLPTDVFRKMPPPRFRELSAAEIAIVTQELMK